MSKNDILSGMNSPNEQKKRRMHPPIPRDPRSLGGINSAKSGLKPAVRRIIHLTLPTHTRHPEFLTEQNASRILQILHSVTTTHNIMLHEGCAMPDHVHLIISFIRGRDLNTDIVKKLKGASSRYYLKEQKNSDGHLWARGKNYQEITSEVQFMNTLQYIRNNPTRANLTPNGRILSHVIADFNPHAMEFIPQRIKEINMKATNIKTRKNPHSCSATMSNIYT